jgi:hypothetical protein
MLFAGCAATGHHRTNDAQNLAVLRGDVSGADVCHHIPEISLWLPRHILR